MAPTCVRRGPLISAQHKNRYVCTTEKQTQTTPKHTPDNPPGHGSDVRPTVPPDLRLVVNSAEGKPLKPVYLLYDIRVLFVAGHFSWEGARTG